MSDAARPADAAFAAARDHFSAGLAHLQAGRPAAAELDLRASLALLPGRTSTLTNLAVALLQLDRPAEALPCLDQVLAQAPHDADALGHRGLALNRLHRSADAAAAFERLVQLAPQRPEAWFHLAQTRQMLDQPEAALDAYDRCLALRPLHAASWSQRGTALRDLGRRDDAAASFERALALGDDDDGLTAYYLAAVRGGAAPARAPQGYVKRLFDDYAADFDQHLLDDLGYCAPEVLQRLVIGEGRGRFDSVLDLGCGTGLCGPLFHPLAGRLAGVDLSAAMLAVARGRGVYDELLQADIVDHLAGTARQHDLVLAADVFIYLGDLAPVFAGVQRVLRPGGLFAFSVEPAPAGLPFALQDSLRYAHGDAALRALAASAGLQLRQVQDGALRVDEVHDVRGRYYLLGG